MTPDAENGVAFLTHDLVATTIIIAVRMLASVQFNDKLGSSAGEIREIGSNRKLPNKFVTTQFSVFQLVPECRFRDVTAMT